MRRNKMTLLLIVLFLFAVIFERDSPYLLMLTAAQVIFIPLTLKMIVEKNDWFDRYSIVFIILASVSVILLHMTNQTNWDYLFASLYLLFSIIVAVYGVSRILKRGFLHFEEFSIDIGLIYLAIGGIWFFAHIAKIDTGFSQIITWLTAIHFHYSAFLLPIFIGLLGRIYKPPSYILGASIILISPILLAIGITFSVWLEWFSVVLYIIAIYTFIYYTFQATFKHRLQKWLILFSFGSLGVTILFSFLYAFGRLSNKFSVSLHFMLQFHGLLNCVFFALLGVIGWSILVPSAKQINCTFPISYIRGNFVVGEKLITIIKDYQSSKSYKGLVDQLKIYEPQINLQTLSPVIRDFYENTLDYRLYAEIKWRKWFKPFAAGYRLISLFVQQINLPLSSKEIEMTGDIIKVKEHLDKRVEPRAWVRKIEDEVIFIALYSWHRTKDSTYMNIALPLPGSSMIGILKLNQIGSELQLSSKKQKADSDAGIYLAWNKYLLSLPIEESFYIKEMKDGELFAEHEMWIFSIPFLKISYRIIHRDVQ